MNKKRFIILLLAVFMTTQFSIASAAPVTAILTLTPPVFSNNISTDLAWSASGLPAGATLYVLVWSRIKTVPPVAYTTANCKIAAIIILYVNNAAGTIPFTFAPLVPVDQNVVEFTMTVENAAVADPCTGATPPADTSVLGSTFIDATKPRRIAANPPSLDISSLASHRVACNTFEMWGLGSDNWAQILPVGSGYSGLKSWNQVSTGSFAPPVPLGTAISLLEWKHTFQPSASTGWKFSLQLVDAVGNASNFKLLRDPMLLTNVSAEELENCKAFTDTAGNANELYLRYLADLGLISGNPDGTSGINKTLTRAEVSTLIEKANGFTTATLPIAAPSAACTFTDVNPTDWFAGWVWQACADGFMNGLGGGKFGSADTLTRGQIVTILNNIATTGNVKGVTGTYLAPYATTYLTVLNSGENLWNLTPQFRSLNWTDVAVGAYYEIPVQRAYGWGVADATGPTTFSPDQPILRGEFAKMLYRALSRLD